MKYYFPLLLCLFTVLSTRAQHVVTLRGTVTGSPSPLYLRAGSTLQPLELDEKGHFSAEVDFSSLPAPVAIASVSKRGKILNQAPISWVQEGDFAMTLDLSGASPELSLHNPYPWQEFSEELERTSPEAQWPLITEHFDKFPASYFLYKQREKLGAQKVKYVLAATTKRPDNTLYVDKLAAFVAASDLPRPKPGSKLTTLTLPNRDKAEQTVEAGSKLTLVAVVASGCSFSFGALEKMATLKESYGNDLSVYTIWGDEEFGTFKEYRSAQKSAAPGTALWDEHGFAFTYFRVKATPTFYLLDERGEIMSVLVTAKNLEKSVAKVLAK